jgi:spermidine synthase
MPRGARPLFSLLFFLSGMAGLVYEVCWTRLLRLPMGNTVYSLTAVLTAFMAGLALGAWIAGRWIDRRGHPLRVYGLLEGAIGIFCLALPWIVQAEQPMFRWVYQNYSTSFFVFHVFKLIACGLVVLVPATLMGATLPVLCRYFMNDPARIGLSLGWLYAVNALGAVAGSLLAGFLLIPRLGLRGAMLVGVGTSLTVGAIAWAAHRKFAYGLPKHVAPARGAKQVEMATGSTAGPNYLRRLVLVGYGLSGLAAMVFQIAWARLLALVIGSSVYAFALLVSAFILGLAVGSSFASRVADRLRNPTLAFALAEIGIGATALAMIPVFQRFPEWMLLLVPDLSNHFGRFQVVQFGLILATLLLPTACMGMCLPFVGRAVVRGLDHAAEAVGVAYSSNALGTIVGAFLGGFVLLPGLGMHGAILVGAALNLAVGVVLLAFVLPRRWKAAVAGGAAVAATLALVFLPRLDPATLTSGSYLYADRLIHNIKSGKNLRDLMRDEYAILYYKEGLASTITVKEASSGARLLAINGKVDASDDKDMSTQVLSGHIVALLHPEPRDVAIIGLASGVTLHAVALHPSVRSIECIEIASEMADACRFFDHVNGRVLDDPRVKLVIQDGRNHLTLTEHQYDVIVSEPSNPWSAGIASLYTREFLQACRARLRPHGLACIWIHLYSLDLPTFRSLMRTFQEVFPSCCFWETVYGADYLLVGSRDGLAADWTEIAQRMAQPGIAADLAQVDVRTPTDLLMHHLADADGVRAFSALGEVYSDDRNRLEFNAPRLLYHRTGITELTALHELRQPGYPSWLRLPPGGVPPADAAEFEAAQTALAEFWQGVVAKSHGRNDEATRAFVTALERDPRLRGLPDYLLDSSHAVAVHAIATGDTAVATGLYRRIETLNPNLPDFENALGVVLSDQGRLPEAEVAYRKAIQLKPRSLLMRMNLGLALARQRKGPEAEAQFRAVLQQRPGHAQAHVYLGDLLIDRGDLAGAESESRAAIAANPRLGDGFLLLGEALLQQGSFQPAADALSTALARGAPEARTRALIAECNRKRGAS